MSDLQIDLPELRKTCLGLIQENLLPGLLDGTAKLALPETYARQATTAIETITQAPVRSANPNVIQHWTEAGLWSGVFPLICCVTVGEADFVVGEQMIDRSAPHEKDGSPTSAAGQFRARVLTLARGQHIALPPHTPLPDGSKAHWERPSSEGAFSEILWLQFIPSGATIHLCRTAGSYHGKSWSLFLSDTRLILLAETLIEDLERGTPAGRAAATQMFVAMLLRMAGKLSEEQSVLEGQNSTAKAPSAKKAPASIQESSKMIAKRATIYIQEHLNQALTVERIAAYSYASPSHLNRIFRKELGLSVMNYVMRQRHQMACSLLRDSNLAISEIGQYVGYHEPAHFSHVFAKTEGISPSEFRRRAVQGEVE